MTIGDSPLDYIPTAEQFSWIGSILPLGGLAGAIVCSPLPCRIGRKNSLILSAIIFAISFVMLMFTADIAWILTARFLQGVGSSLVMVVLPIYIGEIASPECRGILSSFIQIGLVGECVNLRVFFFADNMMIYLLVQLSMSRALFSPYQWESSTHTQSVHTCRISPFKSAV